MESITIKVEENLAKEIENAMKHGYATKTEFIREAVRDKIENIRKDKFLMALLKFKGAAKPKYSKDELHKNRERIAREYAKKFGIGLD
jgi:Arc/MetJ-type ribon-helix-helix transcriptional regulator